MAVPLIDILAEEQALPAAELERVLEHQRQRGGTLAEWLVRAQLMSEDDLFFLMSRRMGVPAIPEERLLHLTLTPEVRRRVPLVVAKSWILLPLDLDAGRGMLSVAMFDPSDPAALEQLRKTSRVATIRPYLARRTTILEALTAVYPAESVASTAPLDPLLGPQNKPPVEAIRGKVEIDGELAEEIAALGEAESADLQATAVKHIDDIERPEPASATRLDDASEDGEDWDERTEVVARDDTDETYLAELPPPLPDTDESPASPFPKSLRDSLEEAAALNTSAAEARQRSRLRVADEARTTITGPNKQEHVTTVLAEEPLLEEELEWAADEGGELLEDGLEAASEASLSLPRPEELLGGAPPTDVPTDVGVPAQVGIPSNVGAPSSLGQPANLTDGEALLGELFAGVGVLVAMLEERIDPGSALAREHARLARLVARDLGHDSITIDGVTVAAHLFGLDVSLRRELGHERAHSLAEAFAPQPTKPGGLNPTLRSLGARALGIATPVVGAAAEVIRTVADYLDLRAESDEEESETLVQLLRAGGADADVLDALISVIDDEETLVATRRSKAP